MELEHHLVQLVLMENMRKQKEVQVVQIVQQLVMVIVIKQQDYVHHVKQDMDLPMEFVHNVQQVNMQWQMEKLLVKIVLLEVFQQQLEHLLVLIVPLEHIHLQLQYVQNAPRENGHQKDQEVVVIVIQNVKMINVFKQQENAQVVQQVMYMLLHHAQNAKQVGILPEKMNHVDHALLEHIHHQKVHQVV